MNTDKIYARKIASEYAQTETSDVKALKRLDKKVKMPTKIFAYAFGVASALLFGTGMSFAMKVIGNENTFALGIVLGVVGMACMVINYPIYKKWLQSRKRNYAGDVLEIARKIEKE